jgi:hypothetical protein
LSAVAAMIEKAFRLGGGEDLRRDCDGVAARCDRAAHPGGDWHVFPSRLFVSVAWPSLTWSQRWPASRPLADPVFGLLVVRHSLASMAKAFRGSDAVTVKEQPMPWYFYLAWFFAGAFLTNSFRTSRRGFRATGFRRRSPRRPASANPPPCSM